jgi:arylsulfatase A-like enzyme
MVVRWDDHVPAATVDDRLALNLDVAPTLAAAAGTSMTTDGLDLLGSATRDGFPLEATTGYQGRPAYAGTMGRLRDQAVRGCSPEPPGFDW